MAVAIGRKTGDTAFAMLLRALRGRHPRDWVPDPRMVNLLFAIEHGLDLWHKAKKVCVIVNTIARKKEFRDLGPWASSLRNHLWWCVQNCDRDVLKLKVVSHDSFFSAFSLVKRTTITLVENMCIYFYDRPTGKVFCITLLISMNGAMANVNTVHFRPRIATNQ